MKRLILLTFFLLLGIEALPQTLVCGCGTKKEGYTIEFTIIDSGSRTNGAQSTNCCTGKVIGAAYKFQWEHQGNGVYVMVGKGKQYDTASQAQADCCNNA